MSVAIRAITRLQDADDLNVSLGVGVDEYALCWDNDTARFVLRAMAAGVTDHGALTGLSDDDHAGYALLAGRAGGQTLYGGTAANDDITIHGTSNATRTTSHVLLQPTAGNVGIGTTTPNSVLSLGGTDPTLTTDTVDGADNKRLLFAGGGAVSLLRGAYFYFSGNEYGGGNSGRIAFAAGNPGSPTGNDGTVAFFTTDGSGTTAERLYIVKAGLVGIGTTAPATLLHGLLTSAATNAVTNVLTIGHDTSGTAAAGFGAGQMFALESSTTAAQNAARIQALWYEATHATRKADLVLTAYDTAEREGLRIRGAGSAAAIGFLGATPIARMAHVADPNGGGTVDAEARSAINSILATLEGFGFHATS